MAQLPPHRRPEDATVRLLGGAYFSEAHGVTSSLSALLSCQGTFTLIRRGFSPGLFSGFQPSNFSSFFSFLNLQVLCLRAALYFQSCQVFLVARFYAYGQPCIRALWH